MVADIALTGLAANDPVPGIYVEVNFAMGHVAGSSATYPILVIANKLAASGDATPDVKIYGPDTDPPVQTEGDIIARAGAGSPAHRMFRRITAVNSDTAVYLSLIHI